MDQITPSHMDALFYKGITRKLHAAAGLKALPYCAKSGKKAARDLA